MLPRSSSTGEARRELFQGAQQLPKAAGTRLRRRGPARGWTAAASGPGAAGTCERQRSAAGCGAGREKNTPHPARRPPLNRETADAAGMLRLGMLGMLRLRRSRQLGPLLSAAAALGQLRSPLPRRGSSPAPTPLPSRSAAEAAPPPARPSPGPAVPRPGLCRGRAWVRRAHPLCPALRSPGSGANTRAHRR